MKWHRVIYIDTTFIKYFLTKNMSSEYWSSTEYRRSLVMVLNFKVVPAAKD